MLRKIIGVMAGTTTAMLLITVIEGLHKIVYPLPQGMSPADRDAMQHYIDHLPPTAFVLLLSGYALGSFCCGLVIRLIARSSDKTPAYLAGLGLTTAGIVNFFSYEHPWWVIIVGLLLFLPLTLLGLSILKKKN